jgi:superfamily II DNA or RNA helicase
MEDLNHLGSENRIHFKIFLQNPNFVQVNLIGLAPADIDAAYSIFNTNLTFFDEKVRYTKEFKNHMTDGKVRLFHPTYQVFPVGLLPRVKNLAVMGLPQFRLSFEKELLDIFRPEFGEVKPEELDKFIESLDLKNLKTGKKITPFDHQKKMALRAINGRRISLLACTSSGKSLALYITSRWFSEVKGKRVLIITPSSGLITQMYTNFSRDYGWGDAASTHMSRLYGTSDDKKTDYDGEGHLIESKRILISTWQSLRLKSADFFWGFDVILVDEAHGSKADELQKIISACVNAKWKVGVSGTIPDNGLDAVLIEGSLGRKEIIVRTKELIELGILPPLKVKTLRLQVMEKFRKYLCRAQYGDECTLLSSNGSRKQTIDVMIKAGHINLQTNALVLFRKKEGIRIVKEFLEKEHPEYKIYVIEGEVDADVRDEYRDEINDAAGCIILATYGTMKQGVSIEKLHTLTFAESSKSMYEVIQSLGRVIRWHESKIEVLVYDLVDDASYYVHPRDGGEPYLNMNYAMEHYLERLKYYADEEFPVEEYLLPFEETIYPEVLKIKEAEREEKNSKKKKPKPHVHKPSGFKI